MLSFQGPEGGLTFPMRGASLQGYRQLWRGLGVVDIGAVVMALTVLLSLSAGLAFGKRLAGGNVLFYVTVAVSSCRRSSSRSASACRSA